MIILRNTAEVHCAGGPECIVCHNAEYEPDRSPGGIFILVALACCAYKQYLCTTCLVKLHNLNGDRYGQRLQCPMRHALMLEDSAASFTDECTACEAQLICESRVASFRRRLAAVADPSPGYTCEHAFHNGLFCNVHCLNTYLQNLDAVILTHVGAEALLRARGVSQTPAYAPCITADQHREITDHLSDLETLKRRLAFKSP
jgi:hypothetical protein